MFFKACFLIKSNGDPIPHLLEKFLFKTGNDNVCELKGGRPVNGIASELTCRMAAPESRHSPDV